MRLYPRVFFACHQRHRRDPKTRREISANQASVLDHLDAVEPTLVGELAEHMGVTPSTSSLSLSRLERQGYVMRLRDPGDKRRVKVLLTPAGACTVPANGTPTVPLTTTSPAKHTRMTSTGRFGGTGFGETVIVPLT